MTAPQSRSSTPLASKLYLIGGGIGKHEAPFDGMRWGVNATCLGIPVHMSFHMHDLENSDQYRVTGTQGKKRIDFSPFLSYVKFMEHPVLSIKEYPSFPSITKYPYETICEYFHTNYFSNSLCYMLAYALWKGYGDISLYGFNFILSDEYKDELPGVHFWLGVATSMGLIPGKTLKVFGNMSSLFHCVDGNTRAYRASYTINEPLWYVPKELPVRIMPYRGGAA